MPEGIPPPALGELVFEAELQIGEIHDLGQTQYGHRLQLDVVGGTLSGPEIEATFLDRGLDYQLTLANGAVEVEQLNILETSDSESISFRNCGVAPAQGAEVRVVPDFERTLHGAHRRRRADHRPQLRTGGRAGARVRVDAAIRSFRG